MQHQIHSTQLAQAWHNERGSLLVQKAGLAMATAVLILGLAVMFQTRGGEIGNSLVQVFTCQLGRFGGGGGAGCGAPAATTPGGGGGGGGGSWSGNADSGGGGGGGFLDGFQTVLDVVGLVPIIGEPADALNAGIYLARGDYVNAGLSAAALFPFGGQAATGGKLVLKYGDEAAAVVRSGDEVAALTRQQDEAASLINRDPCISSLPIRIAGRGMAIVAAAGGCSFPPGSAQHKEQRWEEYQQRMREEGKDGLPYEQWSNVYDANMVKARRSSEAVQNYRDQRIQQGEDWPDYEATVDVDGNPRRLDIANVAEQRAIEHKRYESGKVNNTEDIRWEVERDSRLVRDGWDIEWVFEGTEPSGPLRESLERAGIRITIVP